MRTTSIVIGLLLIVSACFAKRSFEPSHETSRIEQLARSLLKEHRYIEAVAYLHTEVDHLPEDARRLPLLLLLADGLLNLGKLDEAGEVIVEAEDYTRTESEDKAIEELKYRRKLMQSLLPPSSLLGIPVTEVPGDTLEDTLRAVEAGKPSELEQEILISNSFFETDLRNVLMDLSMASGVPIVWDPAIKGVVTYEAVEKPLEKVLREILQPIGYTFRMQEGTYFVGSPSPQDPAFALLSITEVITLSNIDAREAIALLSDFFKPYVKASTASNMVCITAPQAIVDRIRSDLVELDKPQVQISIEVIVAEISTYALHKMGLDWTLSDATRRASWQIGTEHTDIPGAAIKGGYTEVEAKIGEYTVDLLASLEALTQSGDARIRANPRITTLNGRKAQIGLVKDQYFIIQTGTSLEYRYNTLQAVTSGITLEITPYASASGEITVNVSPKVGDVVGVGTEGLPEINTRSASTSVRVKNGETFTIGGLKIEQDSKIKRKIPLLGDIPLFGYLFRYDERQVKDNEIIIFITPHIVGA